jgi:hypothetical protein
MPQDLTPHFELEMHGPVVELGPGESFTLEEMARLEDVADEPSSAIGALTDDESPTH